MKINARMLFDRDPIYTRLADKNQCQGVCKRKDRRKISGQNP